LRRPGGRKGEVKEYRHKKERGQVKSEEKGGGRWEKTIREEKTDNYKKKKKLLGEEDSVTERGEGRFYQEGYPSEGRKKRRRRDWSRTVKQKGMELEENLAGNKGKI